MKRIAVGLLVCWAHVQARAAEPQWLTDMAKAQAQAQAEKKMLLMDFTGSDWCGWCIKFDKEVLSSPEFKEYAATNLVLVVVDFPHNKPQSSALKEANHVLGQKYKVDGYPTFVVLDKNGKEIGRQVGYISGGPKAFIEELEKFKSKG